MVAAITGTISRKKIPAKKIPSYLIYEIWDGKPIYYKGYEDVVNGIKTKEEIMGASALQSFIITYLQRLIFKYLSDEEYVILSNEAGIQLRKKSTLAGDILIFESAKYPIENIDVHYSKIPPKIAIEIDIIADTKDLGEDGYIYGKTQKLLDFGCEKVIWITTKNKKVLIATPNEDWILKDWNKDVEIFDKINFNIGQYLQKKGSPFA
ncbi:MAG: Uma2 family endonuclease [Emticicia sp.]|nr:Uma2 family endonuclease [Emticicia sp.]